MYLGIDLGGTKIAYALSDEQMNIKKEDKVATADQKEAVFEQLVKIISADQNDLKSVGIGTPGMIDNRGKVINAPNLNGWNDFALKDRLKQKFSDLDIFIENDANCAAIAENINGPASKYDNFIYITVSTGVGGGIIINDTIYRGANGIAGEIGHMVLVDHGPLCGCGRKGCWEALASGTAMARDAAMIDEFKELAGDNPINTELLAKLSAQGNQKAQDIFVKAAGYHAQAINNLKVLFDPQAFIIGGGVTRSGDIFWENLNYQLQQYSVDIPILKAANNSGTIGALALAIKGN